MHAPSTMTIPLAPTVRLFAAVQRPAAECPPPQERGTRPRGGERDAGAGPLAWSLFSKVSDPSPSPGEGGDGKGAR